MIRSLNLEELGRMIESVDELLMILLAHRMTLSANVGAYKRATGQPIVRQRKERARLAKTKKSARALGLNPDFAASLLYDVIGESCKRQVVDLQAKHELPPDVGNEAEWQQFLRRKLLALTKLVAPTYDAHYCTEFFASQAYLAYETSFLYGEASIVADEWPDGLFVDLGCATGTRTLPMAQQFHQVIGYDVSPHMIKQATLNKTARSVANAIFENVDVERGIPLLDESAAFVAMTLGTASDICDVNGILAEIRRVLRPKGRFFLSFYNRDALVYRWPFLPWPVSLAAGINLARNCLDVRVGKRVFSVSATAYTMEQIRGLLPEGLSVNRSATYPTISPVLPNCLFVADRAREAVVELDERFAAENSGAYAIVSGVKEG